MPGIYQITYSNGSKYAIFKNVAANSLSNVAAGDVGRKYTSLYCLVSLWSCRPEALAEPLPVRLKAG